MIILSAVPPVEMFSVMQRSERAFAARKNGVSFSAVRPFFSYSLNTPPASFCNSFNAANPFRFMTVLSHVRESMCTIMPFMSAPVFSMGSHVSKCSAKPDKTSPRMLCWAVSEKSDSEASEHFFKAKSLLTVLKIRQFLQRGVQKVYPFRQGGECRHSK